ncbi:MAG: T9SS type A sorting domain-containing protein [Flavobacteriaceae bacterium]
MYKNIGDVWTQIGQNIEGENIEDFLGWSVSLSSDGSTIAIGVPIFNVNISNYVRIYKNIGDVWTQIGSDIEGENVEDFFGRCVSLSSDGSIVAIGAYNAHSSNGNNTGYVKVYKNINNIWTQIGQNINGEASFDLFGMSINLSSDGSVVVIGAPLNDDNGDASGHVRVYQNINNVWTQVGVDINGENIADGSGYSISLSSDVSILAIGAYYAKNNNGDITGHVRVYDLSTVLSLNSFSLSKFNIYPNPTKYEFSIQLEEGTQLKKLNIYNQLGQFIYSTNTSLVKTKKLSQGIYFVEIETNKGISTEKLIIN